MTERYPISVIADRIKKYGESYEIKRKGIETHFLNSNGKKIPILVTAKGVIGEDDVDKIAENIALEKGKIQTDIYSYLTAGGYFDLGKALEKKLVASFLALFTAGLIFFVSIKARIITGFAISEISTTTNNLIIILCILGIFWIVYSFYFKKNAKKRVVKKKR
jgi:hypothetical protein